MKIAIVNDSMMAVETLRRVLMVVPDYKVAWVASDGAEAIAKCAKDLPDLILMNLTMPVIDGVEATRQIMKHSPCAILVVTASIQQNSSKVFEALGYGALDAVSLPVLGTRGNPDAAQEVLTKIATIGKLIGKSTPNSKSPAQNSQLHLPPLIAIGASTGGPKALATILSNIPASFSAAIVIVQHVDVQFASGLVEWLNNQTPLGVQLASDGSRPQVGKVLIAGTKDHLFLTSNLRLTYTSKPSNYPYRPSVDVFFKSVAEYWKRKGTAVLLTGMGRDGAEGLKLLRSKGWHTIAQDKSTCVVYGMPKAAAELKAAVEILPLDAIAPALIKGLAFKP
ncbi:chemotaxis response regulator protein-glutamate methylesterase [Moorena producens JHB]|uniref:Protein-glutamate methylesterase/protein-glutamine glutaminase n=1 Tax=Moorena producens (strain JHB) TaxID=1454205 RepID=A0A1D9G0B0_MOOP1|nr:chemotaxis response regulator protein-glutamate methylesterase [Moorena producens]AOY81046.1 chemotaxis response regulator protein-glutamate methylesterase [Moorena producens JHB]